MLAPGSVHGERVSRSVSLAACGVVGGGVAANQFLRDTFKRELIGVDLFFPKLERCTDNGAMVAVAGSYRIQQSNLESSIKIRPRWDLSEI